MKRRNRFLALLTALCLAVGMLAVPAAAVATAEDVTRLERELENANQELRVANSALETAKTDVGLDAKQTAADEADEEVRRLKQQLNELDSTAADYETLKQDLETQISDAEGVAQGKKTELDNAKKSLESYEDAVSKAETKVTDKTRELEAARAEVKAEEDKKNEAAQTPTGSDISYPASVDFGKLAKGTTSGLTKTFTIANRSSYNMVLSSSSVSGYAISGASGTLSAGSSTTVTVRLDSTSAVGSYNGTLAVSAAFENGTGSYPFSIALYAEVVNENYSLSASPASKDFGKLSEGYEEKAAKDLEIAVTIENKGASAVQMNGVKGSDHFTVTAVNSESETLKTGEKTDYKIAPKHGLAVGTYTDTITFQTKEGATASFKATVAVEKKVASLTVEPAALNFGTVEEGYTALDYQTVTVKNNTDGALLLTQPSSYSYEISALTKTVLPAGGTVSLNIRPRTGLPANQYGGVIEINGSAEQAKLNVQFTVTRPAGPTSFSDVPSDSTFAGDIAYVSQKGLMSGMGNGSFSPKAPITRGQLVTILYRLEGQPAVSGLGFSDVAAGSFCEKAVKWAAATGITTGGADGLFKPNDPISRQQMATFMYRYNQHKGYFTIKFADLSTFPDVDSVASYAKDAMSWANGSGLINGNGAGQLNPSGGANRGQAAAILHRYCVSIGQ